jgi:type I restriction enzyme R subunit
MLTVAGWVVQDYSRVNLGASRGVAVREFIMKAPHGRADYLLFVDGEAVGVAGAKKEGETLTGVAWQTAKYVDGLPDELPTAVEGAFALRLPIDRRRDALHEHARSRGQESSSLLVSPARDARWMDQRHSLASV